MQVFRQNFLFLVSFITNIPLQKTIDININLIFNQNPDINIKKKELKFFFLFCYITDSFYFYNSKFYNQIDGVAMVFPLAPAFANIFMGFHESKWLNEYNLKKAKVYLRHADGILAAFDKKQDSLNF